LVAATRSSSPQRWRLAHPATLIASAETDSLGKLPRSVNSTRYPYRTSSMAVREPAQRAPTTMTSYILAP